MGSPDSTENGSVTIRFGGISRKTLVLCAGLLGLGTGGAGLGYRGPIIAWLISPALEAKAQEVAKTVVPAERARTDSVIKATFGTMTTDISRIKAILEDMPEGKRAAWRIDHTPHVFH